MECYVHWKMVLQFTEEGLMEESEEENRAAYHINQQVPKHSALLSLPQHLVKIAPLAVHVHSFSEDYGTAGPSGHGGQA